MAAPPIPLRALTLIFSGGCALALELVWLRELRLELGAAPLATGGALACLLASFGAGAALARRLAGEPDPDRGRARDAHCQLAIGALGLISWFALGRSAQWTPLLIGPLAALTAALSGAAVTLASRTAREEAGALGATLFGAGLGLPVTVFALLPALGTSGTVTAAGLGSLASGGVGLFTRGAADRAPDRSSRPGQPGDAPPEGAGSARVAAALGCASFGLGVWAVAALRALGLVAGTSLQARASGVAILLIGVAAGIGIGNAATRARAGRARPDPRLARCAGLAAGLALLCSGGLLWLPALPDLLLTAIERTGTGPSGVVAASALVQCALVLPPALAFGALLASVRTGGMPLWSGLGSGLGALAAIAFGVPLLGLGRTILVGAGASLGAVAFALAASRDRRRAALGGLALAAALLFPWLPAPWDQERLTTGAYRRSDLHLEYGVELEPYERPAEQALLYYADGARATLSVHRAAGRTWLRADGWTRAGSRRHQVREIMSAHLPMLFGGGAASALVVGLGSGTTAGSLALYPLERIDVVEPEPLALEAARYFEPQNGRPLEDPRVRVRIGDARRLLRRAPGRYDAVISNVAGPWDPDGAALLTREHLALVRHALTADGRLLQWLPLHGVDPRSVRSILSAVRAEFPFVYAASPRYGVGDVLLLATLRPLRASDLPSFESLSARVRADLERIGVHTTEGLWSLLRLLPRDVQRIAEGVPPNSDARPLAELRAPFALQTDTSTANWSLFEPFPLAALPLLASVDVTLEAERIARLALVYAAGRRDVAAAVALREAALRLGAPATAAQVRLGWDLLEPKERAVRLDDAVAEDPDTCLVRLMRADTRLELGRADAALEDLEVCLTRQPWNPRARAARAQALVRAGRLREAAAEYDALLAYGRAGDDPGLLRAAAATYLDRGRLADGARLLEASLARRPDSPGDWESLAAVRDALGEPRSAERARRNAGVAARNQPAALHREARRARWLGDRERAERLLRQLVAAAPNHAGARRDLEALTAD